MDRCMAISVVVFVGQAKEWLPELEARVKALKVRHEMTRQHDSCQCCLSKLAATHSVHCAVVACLCIRSVRVKDDFDCRAGT